MSARRIVLTLLLAIAAIPSFAQMAGELGAGVILSDDMSVITSVCRVGKQSVITYVSAPVPDTFSFVLDVTPQKIRAIVNDGAPTSVSSIAESYAARCTARDSLTTKRIVVRCVADGPEICRVKALNILPPNILVWERVWDKGGVEFKSPRLPFAPDIGEYVSIVSEITYDEAQLFRSVRYPDQARRRGIEGLVIVGALIGANGCIESITIIESDHIVLNQSSLDAVLSTEFTPAMENGKPIRVWVQLPIRYILR